MLLCRPLRIQLDRLAKRTIARLTRLGRNNRQGSTPICIDLTEDQDKPDNILPSFSLKTADGNACFVSTPDQNVVLRICSPSIPNTKAMPLRFKRRQSLNRQSITDEDVLPSFGNLGSPGFAVATSLSPKEIEVIDLSSDDEDINGPFRLSSDIRGDSFVDPLGIPECSKNVSSHWSPQGGQVPRVSICGGQLATNGRSDGGVALLRSPPIDGASSPPKKIEVWHSHTPEELGMAVVPSPRDGGGGTIPDRYKRLRQTSSRHRSLGPSTERSRKRKETREDVSDKRGRFELSSIGKHDRNTSVNTPEKGSNSGSISPNTGERIFGSIFSQVRKGVNFVKSLLSASTIESLEEDSENELKTSSAPCTPLKSKTTYKSNSKPQSREVKRLMMDECRELVLKGLDDLNLMDASRRFTRCSSVERVLPLKRNRKRPLERSDMAICSNSKRAKISNSPFKPLQRDISRTVIETEMRDSNITSGQKAILSPNQRIIHRSPQTVNSSQKGSRLNCSPVDKYLSKNTLSNRDLVSPTSRRSLLFQNPREGQTVSSHGASDPITPEEASYPKTMEKTKSCINNNTNNLSNNNNYPKAHLCTKNLNCLPRYNVNNNNDNDKLLYDTLARNLKHKDDLNVSVNHNNNNNNNSDFLYCKYNYSKSYSNSIENEASKSWSESSYLNDQFVKSVHNVSPIKNDFLDKSSEISSNGQSKMTPKQKNLSRYLKVTPISLSKKLSKSLENLSSKENKRNDPALKGLSRELRGLAQDECKELRGLGFHPTHVLGTFQNDDILPSTKPTKKENPSRLISKPKLSKDSNLENISDFLKIKGVPKALKSLLSDECKELKRLGFKHSNLSKGLSLSRSLRSKRDRQENTVGRKGVVVDQAFSMTRSTRYGEKMLACASVQTERSMQRNLLKDTNSAMCVVGYSLPLIH